MSVNQFDPNDAAAEGNKAPAAVANPVRGEAANSGVTVTATAKRHIQAQLNQSGASQVRLGVKESGCNGFMYTLDFVEAPTADDVQMIIDGQLSMVVSQADMPLVGGTQIDLITEGLNSALRFKNPNAESHCGCGESFSITPV